MSTHALLSPSASIQWYNCHGSLHMQAGEEDRTTIYAEEGDAMHAFGAAALTEGRPAAAYLHRIFTSDDEGIDFEVKPEDVEHMQLYLDRIEEYRTKPGQERMPLMVEQRVFFGTEIGQPDELAFGKADAIVLDYADDELQVHDLKWGMGVMVYAEMNSQAMLYAVGALRLVDTFFLPKRIRIVIHQPRKGHLDEWTVSTEELLRWAAEPAAVAARKALAMLKGTMPIELSAGRKQCRFCAAFSNCPEARNAAIGTAVEGFEPADTPAARDVKPVPTTIEALGRAAAWVPFIEDWCRAVTGKLDKVMIEQGLEVPGFKVVLGKAGNRYWRDETAAAQAVSGFDKSVTHTPPKPPALLSPAQLEKTEVKRTSAWTTVQEFVGQEPGRKTVVPASDKRPAVANNATEGFE